MIFEFTRSGLLWPRTVVVCLWALAGCGDAASIAGSGGAGAGTDASAGAGGATANGSTSAGGAAANGSAGAGAGNAAVGAGGEGVGGGGQGGGPTSWTYLSNTGMTKNFSMIIDAKGIIYVSSPAQGVMRSLDRGGSFSPLNSGLPSLCHYGIGFNDLGEPIIGEGLNPACSKQTAWQLFRLPAGTTTWVQATGLGNNVTGYTSFWNQAGVNPKTGEGFVGGTRGEWLSSDHGASYTLAALPPDGHNAGEDLASYGDKNGTMWVGTAVDGLYYSTTNGASWTLLGFPPGLLSTDILWITEYNNKLELAMGSGRDVWCYAPYFPPNSGTWTHCSSGLPQATMTQFVANNSQSKLFVNSGSVGSIGRCGIFSSADGSNWMPADDGIPPGTSSCGKADVRFIAVDPTTGYFYALLFTGEIYKTTTPQ